MKSVAVGRGRFERGQRSGGLLGQRLLGRGARAQEVLRLCHLMCRSPSLGVGGWWFVLPCFTGIVLLFRASGILLCISEYYNTVREGYNASSEVSGASVAARAASKCCVSAT